ncbi:MAG: rRNA maturation RNase YbeY [Balneola sp.]|nr:rRNA maturation RNase YbeY [Balneola sp.]MBO6651878.1 rRNA maturation RNase YbeY [Balneola sp.]MBO6710403.1 rRNA maturation RNase YbeY [Balneola sp.]MBO6799088.1 rRNA maturation RNase YbeY [Balneola sp.]MBO6870928.1 rRNA maturation RNase YbeY [Balneola sp.]
MAETYPLQIFNTTDIDLPCKEIDCRKVFEFVAQHEKVIFELVELAYVDEQEIIRINKEFLKRDYITDIISFRYDEDDSNTKIEGTLYCCLSRIIDQAKEFNQTSEKECLRILIHGLLHLIGYEDQSEAEKEEMTNLENLYLSMFYE